MHTTPRLKRRGAVCACCAYRCRDEIDLFIKRFRKCYAELTKKGKVGAKGGAATETGSGGAAIAERDEGACPPAATRVDSSCGALLPSSAQADACLGSGS